MKKVTSFLIAVLLLMGMSLNVFAATNDSITQKNNALISLEQSFLATSETIIEQEAIKKTIDAYVTDNNMFLQHFEQDSVNALQMVAKMVERAKKSAMEATPFWDHITSWGVDNVPSFKQRTNTWCGVASATQVILGLGKTISGADYDAKQLTVGRYLNLADNNDAMVYQVNNAINYFSPYSNYGYINATNMTYDTFISLVKNNLTANRPLILHSIPKYISSVYPSTATIGHYIVIDEMRIVGGRYYITINDCNYQDAYFGRRLVSGTEAYDAIHSTPDRYIIY